MAMVLQIQPSYDNIDSYVAFARENNLFFEIIELSVSKDIDIAHVQAFADTGLVKSFHGAFIDVNPVSNNPAIRSVSRNQMKESCTLARRLGAQNIVFHGTCFPFLRDSYLDSWVIQSAEFYDKLQRETGLDVFIENSWDVDTTPLSMLMGTIGNPKVKVCLDLGHANLSRERIGKWFLDLGDKIGYIHLSDNNGFFDRHNSLGDGNVDWSEADTMFRLLQERSLTEIPLTIEVNTLEQAKRSLEFLESNHYFIGEALSCSVFKTAPQKRKQSSLEKMGKLNERLEEENQRLGETINRYLSKDIAKHIMQSPQGMELGGEKSHLTVMMSDLRSFTTISEHMNAHDLLEMLNHYLGEMTVVINRHKGTVIEFIGDGIMAIFGAPLESGSHASDAVKAAVEMQNTMDSVNSWNAEYSYPNLKMGIGVCTGSMIVGNIGSTRHAKFGVIGSNVNLCGRIQSYTSGGQIYISDQTKKEIPEPLVIEETIKVIPKGMDGKIAIHRVSGIDNVSCKRLEVQMEKLKTPIPVIIRRVVDKEILDHDFHGHITARSDSRMKLEGNFTLGRFDNLQITFADSEDKGFFNVVSILNDGVYCIE